MALFLTFMTSIDVQKVAQRQGTWPHCAPSHLREGYCGHAQGGRGASLPDDPDIISGTKPRQELLADFRLVFGDGFERTLDRRPALVLAEPLQIIDDSGAAPGQLVVRIAGLQLC